MKQIVILWLLVVGHSMGVAAQESATRLSPAALDRYESFLIKEINENRLAGAVSLIAQDGEIVHHKAFGSSHKDQQDKMSTDHIFYIQSMTKPVISVAFMTLYEEGKFLLTDPVSKYLPAAANLKVAQIAETGELLLVNPKEPILMWHLLSHTAGFSHGLGQNEYEQRLSKALYEHPHQNIKERVDTLLSYPLMAQPGDKWNYSASPDILAFLIQHFSGMPVNEFLDQRIFNPLGMTQTGYNVDEDDLQLVAGLHQRIEDGSVKSSPDWGLPQGNQVYGGTHGLYSTAKDYFRFAQMVLNGGTFNGQRILGRKTLDLMLDDHIEHLDYTPGLGFGLGFGVKTDIADTKLVGSKGSVYWSGLFNTYFFIDRREDLIGILMSQAFPYTDYYGIKMRQFIYSALD